MDKKCILIVEDEAQIAATLGYALEQRLGGMYDVEVSLRADDAQSRFQQRHFDLVVTDLRMPGTGGFDLIRQIRQISPQTRVMLITAFDSPQVEIRAHRLGAAYLPKPFKLQKFIDAVRHVLGKEACAHSLYARRTRGDEI
jgi:DNA-binding response OmpR family regulator